MIRPYLNDPNHSHFINSEVLERYWEVGGIRLDTQPALHLLASLTFNSIEDNVLVTDTGCEILTTVPKEVHELEAIISRDT